MRPWHVAGYEEADELAGTAGKLHELLPYVTETITEKIHSLALTQRRLAAFPKFCFQEVTTRRKTTCRHRDEKTNPTIQ